MCLDLNNTSKMIRNPKQKNHFEIIKKQLIYKNDPNFYECLSSNDNILSISIETKLRN